ncbi:lysophospholipase L1-like esterase [Inquilinus ginsengisoli]|uniref:Lysophospholipase L1-like esterase n=1 Tax=Inquilinus ginsengisoli TaxID=363840 RepID=A0ABU1JHZ7_9PROT|nr:GDSL-type esterase/lipase family protein [Inquilinus ginsengisoli]MDR6288234.1 lysophospholipase L1-like esterase [Inquilinus ginsengisoli]
MKILALILAALVVAVALESQLPQRVMARFLPDAAFIQPRHRVDPLPVELSRLYPTIHADIVMLGDSITAAPQWSELLPGRDVVNRGASGDTVGEILGRINAVTRLRPRLVFVLAGTNDLGYGTPPAALLQPFRTLIDELRKTGAGVVVQSVLYVTDDHAWPDVRRHWDFRRNDQIRVLNEGLRALATETGSDYLDLNAGLAPNGALPAELTTDGLHLSAAAYIRWAAMVEAYLRSARAGVKATGG